MNAEGVSCYHFDDLRVDVEQHELFRADHRVALPELSWRLLCTLCEEAPAVVAKDNIAERVWSHSAVSDETIAQRVRLLRKAIGDDQGEVIVAVRGIGYRLARPTTVSARRGLRAPIANIDAYNAYLLGQHFTFEQTLPSLEKAVRHLHEAIRLEPEFAAAHCALGWAWCFLGSTYGNRAPSEVFQNAKTAAMNAVSLDPDSADAHSLMADIFCWYDWDFIAAEREHRVAVSLQPGACLGYALMLAALERYDEAIGMLEARLAVTPDDTYVRVNLAWRYLEARRFDAAIEMAQSCTDRADAGTVHGIALLCQNKLIDAITQLEQARRQEPDDPARLANLARAYAAAGENGKAGALQQALVDMSTHRYVSPFLHAIVDVALGNADRAFEHLEDALAQRSRDMIFLRNSPALDAIRDDPRFASLVERVGLNR